MEIIQHYKNLYSLPNLAVKPLALAMVCHILWRYYTKQELKMQFYAVLASLFGSLPLFAIHLAINVPKIAMIIAAIAELSMYSIIIPFIYVFSIKQNY